MADPTPLPRRVLAQFAVQQQACRWCYAVGVALARAAFQSCLRRNSRTVDAAIVLDRSTRGQRPSRNQRQPLNRHV